MLLASHWFTLSAQIKERDAEHTYRIVQYAYYLQLQLDNGAENVSASGIHKILHSVGLTERAMSALFYSLLFYTRRSDSCDRSLPALVARQCAQQPLQAPRHLLASRPL